VLLDLDDDVELLAACPLERLAFETMRSAL
jgi:hypothetical protein